MVTCRHLYARNAQRLATSSSSPDIEPQNMAANVTLLNETAGGTQQGTALVSPHGTGLSWWETPDESQHHTVGSLCITPFPVGLWVVIAGPGSTGSAPMSQEATAAAAANAAAAAAAAVLQRGNAQPSAETMEQVSDACCVPTLCDCMHKMRLKHAHAVCLSARSAASVDIGLVCGPNSFVEVATPEDL